MLYENVENFHVIPSIEDVNNPRVRLFCSRQLYIAHRSNTKTNLIRLCDEIGHGINGYWSTFWLDVLFESEIGNHLVEEKHLIYVFDPPKETDVIKLYTAIPSPLCQGYWELEGKKDELYFCASVSDYGEILFNTYYIKMTNTEVLRLKQRIAFNENCYRRAEIYNYLLQN